MINNASFRNFRAFENLELSDLKNITLISGRNNSGKSSVLEGVFLALSYNAPDSFSLLNNIRGISYSIKPEDLWNTIFHNLLLSENISINLVIDGLDLALSYARDDSFVTSSALSMNNVILKQFISSSPQSYSLKFDFSFDTFSENGYFVMNQQGIQRYSQQNNNSHASVPYVHYIHSSRTANNAFIAEMFGSVVLKDKKDRLIHCLQSIDPSIADITTVLSGNLPQLYAKVNGQWLPSRLAGDGFDHLLLLISSMIANPDSILLIDEIETGFHYSVYDNMWEAVMLTAKQEHCQLIATTHSYECLESAVNQSEANGMQDDFCYFRLGKDKQDNPKAYRFSQEILLHATDNNLEVR